MNEKIDRQIETTIAWVLRVMTPKLRDRMSSMYTGRVSATISIQRGLPSHVGVRHCSQHEPSQCDLASELTEVLRDSSRMLNDELQTVSGCVFHKDYYGELTLIIPMWQGQCGRCYTEALQNHKLTV